MNILIIEHEPLAQSDYEAILPYNLHISQSAQEAVKVIKNPSEIDIIIFDDLISNPINGLRDIHNIFSNIPIIIMSSNKQFIDLAATFSSTYLMKEPFDIDAYIEAIESVSS